MNEQYVEIGEGKEKQSLPIIFTTNAALTLDIYLRKNDLGTVAQLMTRLQSGMGSNLEIHTFFWAMLEGGRKKKNTRVRPYSLDEVGDMIDLMAGGMQQLTDIMIEALRAAAPKAEPAAGGAAADSKNDKADTGTGMPSSKPESASESELTTSGT